MIHSFGAHFGHRFQFLNNVKPSICLATGHPFPIPRSLIPLTTKLLKFICKELAQETSTFHCHHAKHEEMLKPILLKY